MVFDVYFYAGESLKDKSYAYHYIVHENKEYLKYNYPKVTYEALYNNAVDVIYDDCDDDE